MSQLLIKRISISTQERDLLVNWNEEWVLTSSLSPLLSRRRYLHSFLLNSSFSLYISCLPWVLSTLNHQLLFLSSLYSFPSSPNMIVVPSFPSSSSLNPFWFLSISLRVKRSLDHSSYLRIHLRIHSQNLPFSSLSSIVPLSIRISSSMKCIRDRS